MARIIGSKYCDEGTRRSDVLQGGRDVGLLLEETSTLVTGEPDGRDACESLASTTESVGTPVDRVDFPVLSGRRITSPLHTLSPLRYPGSKRKITPAIAELIQANVPEPELFVEPFGGGASVSLGLLQAGAVQRVLIADLNPLVAAFWNVVTTDTDWLISAMQKEDVTVDRWDYWKKAKPTGRRNRALKCLFLNRTTFSGIIGGNAGPIGGRAQKTYKIDCRFDKNSIEARLRHVRQLADEGKIFTAEGTWQQTMRLAQDLYAREGWRNKSVVFYMDPPYIEKASDIYERSFSEKHHRELAAALRDTGHRWILSYDHEPLVLSLYNSQEIPEVKRYAVSHTYTMAGSRENPLPGREVIFTNLPQAPGTLPI